MVQTQSLTMLGYVGIPCADNTSVRDNELYLKAL